MATSEGAAHMSKNNGLGVNLGISCPFIRDAFFKPLLNDPLDPPAVLIVLEPDPRDRLHTRQSVRGAIGSDTSPSRGGCCARLRNR